MKQPELAEIPDALRVPLLACASGEMAPNLALMHLCMAASDATAVEHAVTSAGGEGRLTELAALWKARPEVFTLVKAVLATDRPDGATDANPDARLAACAALFDAAAALSAEASVALYSLGDPALLAAATDEIVAALHRWRLVHAEATALEIGCGNGRFLKALGPSLGRMIGIDISAAMVEAARRQCADVPNVEVHRTDGGDLAICADGSVDIVLAVDSFPYIVRCGPELVRRHFAEAARVLKPSGHLVILNYSYRGDVGGEEAEVAAHARQSGFAVIRAGTRDFHLWDGVSYVLKRTQP
jgi:SAM-dependent methyltransferase